MPRPERGADGPRPRAAAATWICAATLGIGLALLALMVATEGAPGALPLALVLAGAAGLAVTRWRARGRPGHRRSAAPDA
jgi:hypothetical protein